MEITRAYLNTHVVVWLYTGDKKKLSKRVQQVVNIADLIVSPMVLLELQYMRDKRVIDVSPFEVFRELQKILNITIAQTPFEKITPEAIAIGWTKDPFDRIIVAQSKFDGIDLLTKDRPILKNYEKAIW